MQKLVDKIFRRYGVPIIVQNTGSTYEVYGFVKNGASSARKYLLTEYNPLGEIPMGFFVMLLPRNVAQVGRHVRYGDKWYIIRRFDEVRFHNQVLYNWCLCEERGRVDTWGN